MSCSYKDSYDRVAKRRRELQRQCVSQRKYAEEQRKASCFAKNCSFMQRHVLLADAVCAGFDNFQRVMGCEHIEAQLALQQFHED